MKLRLTLDVEYTSNEVPADVLADNLDFMVREAIGNGMLTGPTEAEVEEWKLRIESVNRVK